MMFVPCAKRVLWGSCDSVVVPKHELEHWKAKFGDLELEEDCPESVRVQVSSLKPEWGPLRCSQLIESSTPDAEGPRTKSEHGPDNTKMWGLFAGQAMVYKSVFKRGRVRTTLSWYGIGAYNPEHAYISKRERARVAYDPEYHEIELM